MTLSQEQYNQLLVLLAKENHAEATVNFIGNSKTKWILDSGASDHIAWDTSLSKSLTKLVFPIKVTLSSGHKLKAQHSQLGMHI